MRAEPALRIGALGLILSMSPLGLFGAPGLTTSLAASPASAQSSASSVRVHQVERGETLYGIAGRYGVSIGSILAANGLKPSTARVRPGQRLAIPTASKTARVTTRTRVRVRPVALTARLPQDFVLAVPKFQDVPPPFQWPVEGPLTSMFGRRRMGWHRGIDIQADPGTPVIAAATGLVIASFVEPRYGNVVKIAHDNGFVTVYAHNERNLVDVGDWVVAGQTIAAVGRTGHATSEHLHFEIRHEGLVYNPLYLLPLPPQVARTEENNDQDEHDE
jgi:murein DD-endopeptidase MepM/ murein hydrolase activator NlpD